MLWHILWKNKNTFSLAFTILFSIISIMWQKNPFSLGVSYIGRVGDRLSGAINASLEFPGSLWVEFDRYRELEKKYGLALEKIEEYRLEQDKFDRLLRENERLRQELGFTPLPEYEEIKASVLGVRINSISPRVIINKGRNDGIEPFMPVITRTYDQNNQLIRAVVGLVASADSTTSIVQPINHPGFRLGVRLPESGQWSILSGNSGRINDVILTYLANDGAPERATYTDVSIEVKQNSLVVTSGSGGIFPSGVPVGYVTSEGDRHGEFKTAYVKTYANISELDIISVIRKTPDQWRIKMDQDQIWDEHLFTEFGQSTYPESSRISKRAKTRKSNNSGNTKTPSATAEKKTTAAAAIPSEASKKEKPDQAEDQKETKRQPRRIHNLNIPGGGN